MDWLNTAQQVLTLISGLIGLISAAIGVFFAIRATIQKNKHKSANEIWNLVMQMADEAMKAAEQSSAKGEDKKAMVIKAVNAAAKAAGLDISAFTSQLSAYIDQTIDFINKFPKKEKAQ